MPIGSPKVSKLALGIFGSRGRAMCGQCMTSGDKKTRQVLRRCLRGNRGTRPRTTIMKTNTVSRLLIVDDHPVVRFGLRGLLNGVDGIEICGEADDAQKALASMRILNPDVALVDVSLPGTNGIDLIKSMVAEHPRILILVLSMHHECLYALRALRAGAKGYVMKQMASSVIGDALHTIIRGGIYVSPQFRERLVFRAIRGSEIDLGSPLDKLSDRELEVLRLFGNRKTTREIAASLHLSVKTIETHRAHIKEKLGIDSADSLIAFAEDWVVATDGAGQ